MYESYAYWKLAIEQLSLNLVVDVVIVYLGSVDLRQTVSNSNSRKSIKRLVRLVCVSFYSVVVLCKPSSHVSAVSVWIHGVVSGSNVYVMFCWEIHNGSCRLQLSPRLCVLTCFLVCAFACNAPRNSILFTITWSDCLADASIIALLSTHDVQFIVGASLRYLMAAFSYVREIIARCIVLLFILSVVLQVIGGTILFVICLLLRK